MSMLPVAGLAAPEQTVAVSAKAETNPGGTASGFAQVLSQQSAKGAVAGQGAGNAQGTPVASCSDAARQLPGAENAGAAQQPGSSAPAAAAKQKTRDELYAKDRRALAGSMREPVDGQVVDGLPAKPSGSQVAGRSAGASSATKASAVKASPADPALLLSDAAAKKDVKDGKDSRNTANGGTPLPVLLAPANPSMLTPQTGKANAEIKTAQSSRLPQDLQSNGTRGSEQASSESTLTGSSTASELFRPVLTTALAADSLTGTATGTAEVAKSKAELQSSPLPGSNSLFGILQMPLAAGNAVSPAQVQLSPSLQEQPAWGQALAQGVQWMAQGGVQQAVIHLHPEHLGPLVVQLELGQNGQAAAVFLSAHADVRAAISAAVPQLQQNFAAMGLNLGQASVGSGWSGTAGEQRNGQGPHDGEEGLADVVAPALSAARTQMTHQGLLSTFV
ncbi:flagellar hook-length control protein FliK [Acidithiobacillus sp. AMEEHan]|uniref:flagellar hook-length control protein FliK n=1 Tax=Acidithiobacillus sp. AMEEHan TaxID=2994951 RepID=UPI0027E4F300|nr:flagellar hook-length control protein FliK [Acidithiobacillus sp. AMEEHan]